MAENDETEKFKKMIESEAIAYGLTIASFEYNEDEGRVHAVIGRFEVVEDDGDLGLWEGAQGTLQLSVVGAEKYNNLKVKPYFLEDDTDCPVEVRGFDMIEEIL